MTRTAIPRVLALGSCLALAAAIPGTWASDHLDTPSVSADPAADLGDLYGWMSPDGRRLNLVMDIVGKRFSDRIAYVFHIDSGRDFGKTHSTATIDCRFDVSGNIRCSGGGDRVAGLADTPAGIVSQRQRFRVFAGLRDDPFANNVVGTRQAYAVAAAALGDGTSSDVAGCPAFSAKTAGEILDRWRHTDGGPAQNFLAGWKTGALVVSIDVDSVDHGGPLLAVWAGTYALSGADQDAPIRPGSRIDRVGRTLTGNALLGPLDRADVAAARKERYNRAEQPDWPAFARDIQRTLGLYDAFDGDCGNQWLASPGVGRDRYRMLARLLADDRLWIDSRYTHCTRYLAVERGENTSRGDCGGRTPTINAIEVYRSLLVNGTGSGVSDGVGHDDRRHSTVDFPFLATP